MWLNPDTTTARNLVGNPVVSFAIDEYAEDWRKTRGIQATARLRCCFGRTRSRARSSVRGEVPLLERGQPANVSFFRLSPSDIQFIEGSEGNGRDQEIGVDYPRDAVYSVFRDLPEQRPHHRGRPPAHEEGRAGVGRRAPGRPRRQVLHHRRGRGRRRARGRRRGAHDRDARPGRLLRRGRSSGTRRGSRR